MALSDTRSQNAVMDVLVLGTFFIAIPAAIIWTVKKVGSKDGDPRNDNPRDADLVRELKF